MMGMQVEPVQLFYEFCLDDHVPADHLVRRIDRFLDLLEEVLPDQDVHRAVVAGVQMRHGATVDPVPLTLENFDLGARRIGPVEVAEAPHRAPHRGRGADEHVDLLPELRERHHDPVQDEEIGNRLHVVDDVVQE